MTTTTARLPPAFSVGQQSTGIEKQCANKQRHRYLPHHGFKGVCHERDSGLWRGRLYHKGTHITLGRFQTAKLAAQAHDRAAVLIFGKNAVTNLGFEAAKEALCVLHFKASVQKRLVMARDANQRDIISHSTHGERNCQVQRHAVAVAVCGLYVASQYWTKNTTGWRGDPDCDDRGMRRLLTGGCSMPHDFEACRCLLFVAVLIPPSVRTCKAV
jgi:hypothetical protein